ncbi:helix-turn-helix transcriptional regulator, partial [Pedobacter sp. UBA5917]|uniref:helix-turn-helix transcriptional regulator n=1 Tax=Pedobacter sp. UBA5917 TaxID=1947061 RepID=UPI0025EDF0EA
SGKNIGIRVQTIGFQGEIYWPMSAPTNRVVVIINTKSDTFLYITDIIFYIEPIYFIFGHIPKYFISIIYMNKRLGKILKRFRQEKGLTQQEVADLLSISRPTYIKWENDVGTPSFIHVYMLIKAYNITFEEFVEDLIDI